LLVRDARLFEQGQPTAQGKLAIELLAQRAYLNADAAEALIDLAAQNLIPADIWPNVLAAIAGKQSITLIRPSEGLRAVQTVLGTEANQVLYRVANTNPPNEANDFEEFRLAMLEELLRFAPVLPGARGSGPGN